MIKIGYVSQINPFNDKKGWSGSIYKLREAIENSGCEVIWIKVAPCSFKIKLLRAYLKIIYGSSMYHPLTFRAFAKSTDWSLVKDCDFLFFPGDAQIMKYAPIKKEYIYYTDACFNQMVDYYWHHFNKSLIKLANEEEKWAIQNATFNIRASEWAKNYAIDYYGGSADKNYVLEFGANIDNKDITESSLYEGGQLNILFSGVEWERKGGEIAIEATKILRGKYGIDAILNIVGINSLPEQFQDLDYVKNYGFLNKNNPEEYEKYVNIIRDSHIFLLPTKAECAGIVFCEASAYGLPIYTHDTGGIGNYVINGVNGYRLKVGSNGEDFANSINKSIHSKELSSLHKGGIQLYYDKLNWDSWSKRFRHIIDSYKKSSIIEKNHKVH